MKWTHWAAAIVFVWVQGIAASASAEIYRWTDAKGGEHFAMDLHSVPIEYRAAAAASAGSVGKGANINRIPQEKRSAPSRSAGPAAARAHGLERSPRASEIVEKIGGHEESWWRNRVQTLRDEMSSLEEQIDACEDLEAPKRYNHRTGKGMRRQHYDNKVNAIDRCASNQSNLEAKRRQLSSLEERARKQGVPPGWLRTR